MDRIEMREMMSALADGQLDGDAFARGMAVAAADPEAMATWHSYHVIGDVLRSADLARSTPADEFMSRLREQLRQEPVAPALAATALTTVVPPVAAAANDTSFRWKVAAGVASVAAVAAIGWTVWSGSPAGAGPQLAGVPPGTVLAGTERGPMIRDPQLDELLAAHRQFGGASALQTPAGFLRNATFDTQGR